uniref:1-alkyl-2-acetylglycerophosphocholine esterase n=1 Tax=Cairina moschata TaxID=8855 RepID=A0A8C3BRN3_CAIMO
MGGEQSLALPPGKGPHGVGCVDVMVGHTRQGLFLRLFYPCEPRAGAERPRWIPRYEYSRGMAQFRSRSPRWGAPLLHIAFGSCRVPVSWKGPFKPRSGGYPLVIFSHGLGVHQRANECVRALRLFQAVRGGRPVPNVLHPDFDLSVLKDGVDLAKVAVMGHSFGGVTAVLALVKEPSFRCAVALDAWMFPLENTLYPEVSRPVLFINAEKFQTPESIAKMKRLSSRNSQTRIITVLGSVHHSQTDFAFLTGKLARRIFSMGGTLDPHKGLDIISRATLAFLQRHLGTARVWGHVGGGLGGHESPHPAGLPPWG